MTQRPGEEGLASFDQDEAYRLVYTEARRSIDWQESNVDHIRERSGTLLAAAAIVTSFLGGANFTDRGWLSWLALLAFVGAAITCLLILWPFGGWGWRHSARMIRENYLDPGNPPVSSLAELYAGLAQDLEERQEGNQAGVERLFRAFALALGLVASEVVLLLLELLV